MSDFESKVLFRLANKVQSWRLLHDPQASGQMDPGQILELCKSAGYTEEASQKAATMRADQRLDHGVPMFHTVTVSQ